MQLQGLLAVRERLTKDAKTRAKLHQLDEQERPLDAQQQLPLDYFAALSLILAFTSSTLAVSSAAGKAKNVPVPTTSAFEALDLVLLRAKAVLTAGAYPPELPLVRTQFSLAFCLDLAATLYTTWENQLPSAQQKLRSSLVTLLALASPEILDFPQVGASLQAKILVDSWNSRRALQTFEAIIRHGVVADFAAFAIPAAEGEEAGDVAEGVVRRFLQGIVQHEEMAPVAGKVAVAWVEKCWAEKPGEHVFWMRPCLAFSRAGDARARHGVTTYVLQPVLVKCKGAFSELLRLGGYVFDENTTPATMDEQDLETALSILKAGNALSLVDLGATSVGDSSKVALPTALFTACLQHSSEALRTSALSLLVVSSSTSALFPLSTFPLLRTFYAYSLGEEDGDFRMSIVSLTGKLFLRLRDSSWRAQRTAAKGKDGVDAAQAYLDAAQAFVAWLLDLVARDNLNPARPFRIKMNSLRLLDLALKARVDGRFRVDDMEAIARAGTTKDATTGYSSYRKGAMTQTPTFQAKHRNLQNLEQSRPSSPSSSSSSPTPTADEAGWPFSIDLVNAATTQTLLRQLLSTYTALRFLVISILERFPGPLPGYEGPEGAERAKRELLAPALKLIRSGREAEASAGAGVIGLVWRKWVLEGVEQSGEERWSLGQVGEWQEGAATTSDTAPRFGFISSLLDLVEQQLSHYAADLAQASAVAPMHGTLLALRHLFISIPSASYDALSTPEERRALFHRALDVVKRVWDVTAPVLAAKAPEGSGAEGEADNEEARAIGFERQGGAETDEGDVGDEGTGGPQHKVILSACWRAMKEAGELLETLVRLPSELDTASFRQIWSYDELVAVGELFGTWLRLARHRGTVANLHPCYTRSAGALLAAGKEWPEVGRLPELWLDQHLKDIVSARISITRRSAALPFIILGLLLTILPSSRPTFDAALTRLFEIAESTTSDITDESRVHAMNTIRTVFLDAKGGVAAGRYVERGFLVSISLFWSPNWICRNVALLLFATLITRAFNARRTNLDRDPASLSTRLTIDDFFVRYPSLEQVLRDELERGWRESQEATPSSNLHSPLFSILMLFSLLQTPKRAVGSADSPVERESSKPFIPLIKACAKSRVWKIRDAAGDALTGLISPEDVGVTAEELLTEIEADLDGLEVDELHGRLVQTLRLLNGFAVLSGEDEQRVSAIYLRLLSSILPPTATLDQPLRPPYPYAISSTFLLISLRLPSSLSDSPLSDLALSYLAQAESWTSAAYHLPSPEEFLRSCWQVVHAAAVSPEERFALLKAGLTGRSLEVKRAALDELEIAAPTFEPAAVASLVIRVVLDDKQAGDVRVRAAEIAHSVPSLDGCEAEYEALVRLYSSTRIVPLREAVLPVLAGLVRSEEQQQETLDLLLRASRTSESVESRESTALALVAFSRSVASNALSARLGPNCKELLARLLQDDDVVVRGHARDAYGSRLIEAKAVEEILESGGQDLRDALLQDDNDDLSRDLEILANPVSLLFAVEKPNIYVDFNLNHSLLLSHLSPDLLSQQQTREQLARLDQAIEAGKALEPGPLGLAGNEIVSRWARVLVQRADAAQVTDETATKFRACV
ncbi:tRNA methylation protein TRM732 [Rhodotorula paludigena]|uniref:tRNA methylation protein TRM732 n=1 Tax=Rhodotorula paludigena TaxID=86838 RepID=UPI0031784CBB